jgi:hypothetical protein
MAVVVNGLCIVALMLLALMSAGTSHDQAAAIGALAFSASIIAFMVTYKETRRK